MKIKIETRQSIFAIIVLSYLIPFLFFSAYSVKFIPAYKSWPLLSFGLFLVVLGSLTMILLLSYWEMLKQSSPPDASPPLTESKETKVTSLDPNLVIDSHYEQHIRTTEGPKELNFIETALKTNQEHQEQLTQALEEKNRELQKQEEETQQWQLKAQKAVQDFIDYKLFSEEQLKQKQLQLASLQQMIEEQRLEIERRQEQVQQLDTKVHNLSHEIKTLFYLDEETLVKEEKPTHQSDGVHVLETTPAVSASRLLKKCIDIAQKLTSVNYQFNESSRYREFSSYSTIDQRRLFDSLRNETGALVIVYSQKENKVLFANQESHTILGWSPEKFIMDFPSIIKEGINEWKKVLSQFSTQSETQVRLLAKTKQGQEVLLNCHLGIISTGLFRNYVIGILYPI